MGFKSSRLPLRFISEFPYIIIDITWGQSHVSTFLLDSNDISFIGEVLVCADQVMQYIPQNYCKTWWWTDLNYTISIKVWGTPSLHISYMLLVCIIWAALKSHNPLFCFRFVFVSLLVFFFFLFFFLQIPFSVLNFYLQYTVPFVQWVVVL